MSSREKILATVKNNQPSPRELPEIPMFDGAADDLAPVFITALEAIGGAAYIVSGFDRIATILREQFPSARRILSACPPLAAFAEAASSGADPHTLESVDLAILPAHFAVAENGACWITEEQMVERVLPFITQHLVLVISRQAVVANMHAAYERIAAIGGSYGFSTFIAGPSKTADIEQSLVLGAHGPMSLTVFLIDEQLSDAGYF
jgi:L-lactate dehydrogenase complex protein LldG